MKKVINYIPYIIAALLPQFIFKDYLWILISTILIGFITQLFMKNKKFFLKLFLIELVLFSIVFFIHKNRIVYLNDVAHNLELPEIVLMFLFPIFNALNISILFFLGYKLSSLLFGGIIKLKSV